MKGDKSKAGTSKKDDTKLSVKRKAAGAVGKKPSKREKNLGKDPNKPKRPPSAFFVFMEEFRKQFQEKNPNNKLVSVVSKAGGAKWKTMSEADKAPYQAKAAKRKSDYEKSMAAYNKKAEGGGGENASAEEEEEEGSDKSKSEVEDEEEEGGAEEEDDEE
ncbi:HMG1/2-like protein [Typha latifolia]|uniref:HMG1/2-like protein n=1 Tax=Typha latifolia TaxID=4733 RepID=UPI003C2AB673